MNMKHIQDGSPAQKLSKSTMVKAGQTMVNPLKTALELKGAGTI